MKKFFTTIAALLPLTTLIAQTYLTQDFGTSATEVAEFLKSKQMVLATTLEDGSIQASTTAYTVTYYFEEEKLYKMETVCEIAGWKEALQRSEGIKTTYKNESALVIDLMSDKDLVRFAALRERKLHEVSTYNLGRGAQVRILSMDLDQASTEAMDQLREDNLLYAMIQK